MTRSLFDPTGDDMLQEGDRFTTPSGQNRSHLPESAVDGKVGDDPDVKVPLIGEKADESLDAKDTEALAKAAQDALAEDSKDPEWPANLSGDEPKNR